MNDINAVAQAACDLPLPSGSGSKSHNVALVGLGGCLDNITCSTHLLTPYKKYFNMIIIITGYSALLRHVSQVLVCPSVNQLVACTVTSLSYNPYTSHGKWPHSCSFELLFWSKCCPEKCVLIVSQH